MYKSSLTGIADKSESQGEKNYTTWVNSPVFLAGKFYSHIHANYWLFYIFILFSYF